MNAEFKIRDGFCFHRIFLCWCILVIVLRETGLVLYPRLWAEEGAVFYVFALHHSIWAILTTPVVGYLTLFNGIVSALQAKVFQPEAAAWVSTVAGFIVQLIPLLIVLFGNHSFWDNPLKKALVCCVIIFFTPPELWLNTTNSHFVFGLITFLILITPTCSLSGLEKWFFRALLFLGALSGPISLFLTPLFFVKWHADRRKENWVQAVIQLMCSIIQAGIVLHFLHLMVDANNYARLQLCDWHLTVQGFFIDNFSLNLVVFSPDTRFILGIFIAVYFIYLCCIKITSRQHLYFIAGFIIVAIISTLGSIKSAGGTRYGYMPTCLLMIVFFTEAYSRGAVRNHGRWIAMVIFIFALTVNGINYKSRMSECYSPAYPTWKDEVLKWRINQDYKPIIWPGHPWYVYL